ncbi:unnamed protein product [Blepharisma stoltei]|uniref:Acyl-coenzyme A oxidase n=1 Tax=Blepharisma stoltei TaxID=1481888 RepID=A0AAU9JPD2_9CILI|nr:unnamed protein product [Blepharisma stoltei]
MAELKRLNLISSHILGNFKFETKSNSLDQYRARGKNFNHDLLRRKTFEPFYDMYTLIWDLMKEKPDLYDHSVAADFDREKLKERCHRQIMHLFPKCGLNHELNLKNPIKKISMCLGFCTNDIVLGTRTVVHIVLYTEALTNLGTDKHLNLINRAYTLKDYGCLGMTEIGHGSNVASIEITATYDMATREFVINSPTPTAVKWWIGAVGKTSNMAVIFAQLILKGINYGVHAFAIPIRDYETHKILDGIIIGDCGHKLGVQGIDNGFMIFRNYRVPYDCFLDRFSQVTPEGQFASSIRNNKKRFGTMISCLIRGRVVCIGGMESYARNALTIAIRYGAIRKQFGPDGERSILDYQLHRYRLMPYLARLFASNAATKFVSRLYNSRIPLMRTDPESPLVTEYHWLITVFKSLSTWNAFKTIQECREACGGHGYSTYAGFNKLKQDADVVCTFEGDNNVIIQQAERYILQAAQVRAANKPIASQYLQFINLQPAKPKIECAEHLKHPEVLISLLEYRCNYYLVNAVNKLQENMGRFSDMDSTWNNTQVRYLFVLPQVFGELLMLKELNNFVKELQTSCPATAQIVQSIMLLYGVHVLENESGMIKTQFTENEVRWINDTVIELCNEVGENAVNIMDAVAFPDHVVASVLGHSDGQAYERYTKVVENAPNCYGPPEWINLIHEHRKIFN